MKPFPMSAKFLKNVKDQFIYIKYQDTILMTVLQLTLTEIFIQFNSQAQFNSAHANLTFQMCKGGSVSATSRTASFVTH